MTYEQQAAERRRAAVRRTCELHGVQITQVGNLFHLRSRHVDIKTTDLSHILAEDLADLHQRKRSN